jgi:succinate dehydrogenase/fumarate reductase flavoprotein subunit
MAYDAGAKFVNMEFFQTGPAVMFPHVKFIIHSHVWRMNPKLVNNAGDEFLKNYCPAGMDIRTALELKAMSYPFSVRTDAKYVDIAIFSEVMAGRGTENMGIYFDVTHVDKSVLSERMPITYKRLKAMGVDPSTDRLQLGLAVQNFNGGILIDSDGFTGVQGLYAAGEASGGVHGSDRPGGNNLTDTQVFGFRAGRAAAAYAREIGPQREEPALSQFDIKASCDEAAMAKKARELFYRRLTVIRNEDGLREVLRFTEQGLRSPVSLAMRNCLTVGRLLARAMLARKESRGTHYREDHPGASGEGHRYILRKNGPDVAVCEQKWSY